MAKRYIYLSLAVCIYILLRAMPPIFERRSVIDRRIIALTENPEARLAVEAKIDLACASQKDLQLIPGVAGNLSEEIVAERERILRKAERLPVNEKYRALEIVHGIGEKKAKEMAKYLELE